MPETELLRKPLRERSHRAVCTMSGTLVTDTAIYIRHIDMFLPWDVNTFFRAHPERMSPSWAYL